jgi:hypothetical protein
MRASPAFQVNLQHFVLWRAAVALLALMAFACTLAWCASGTTARPPVVWVTANSGVLLLVWGAVQATPSRALSLRWDTLSWRLGPIASVGEEPTAGQLTLVMDLGSWMLLRFVQSEPALRRFGLRPQIHLAVQRRGLEPTWHALRSAVYSSRPAKPSPALDEPHPATILE